MSKQCRALQRAGWEKDEGAVLRLAAASDKLVQLHLAVRGVHAWSRGDIFTCLRPQLKSGV